MKMLHQKLNIIKKEEKEKKFYMWLNEINDDGISNQDIINNMIKDILNSISKNYEFDNLKLFKDQIASYIYYNSIKNAIYQKKNVIEQEEYYYDYNEDNKLTPEDYLNNEKTKQQLISNHYNTFSLKYEKKKN